VAANQQPALFPWTAAGSGSPFYETIDLPSPTIDLGCGDGHFATLAFNRPLDVGIDPWAGPVHEAARRGGYLSVIQGSGDHDPFEEGTLPVQ